MKKSVGLLLCTYDTSITDFLRQKSNTYFTSTFYGEVPERFKIVNVFANFLLCKNNSSNLDSMVL